MSTLRDGASPSDKARKLVAELVEVSDKYHNGTHAKSWQIWAVNEIANALAAAAPSLHKEGAGGDAERIAQLEASIKCAAAEERRDCEKALLALAGWYPTPVEGYGFNTSWAISDLCRAIQQLRATSPALPLQRTLPDEQFNGVVVEPIGRAQAISKETLEKLFEEYVPLRPMHPEAKGYMFEMLTAELNEAAASPAGRAEQVLGSTGADFAGEERDRVKPK